MTAPDMEGEATFTVADLIARSGAGQGSRTLYERQLRQVEGWMGKPLGEASKRDLMVLGTRLRGMTAGPQYAKLVRMFYHAAKRPEMIELMKLKQRMKKLAPDEILTLSEVQAMVDVAATLRDKALIACLWETGVRVHELLAVDLGDIKERESPENGGRSIYVLWFKKAKVAGEEHSGYVVEAAPVLKAWLKAHPDRRPGAPLFPSEKGGRLSPDVSLLLVKRFARRAGIAKRVYSHLFRHSRATHLLRLGMSPLHVKRLLGWTPSSVLLEQRYQHLVGGDDYAALLRAQGLEPPKPVELGKLTFDDEALKPVVPMIAPPDQAPPVSAPEIEELLRDPKVLRFLQLAAARAGIS